MDSVTEPIPISLVSGRYLLFDVNVVTYLRRTHNICGVLIGGIPQAPQQNVFLGLPLELIPEEVKLLVEKEAAYIVDDHAWQTERYATLRGEDRKKYLESLRSEGLMAQQATEVVKKQRTKTALAKQAALRAHSKSVSKDTGTDGQPAVNESDPADVDVGSEAGDSLFSQESPSSPAEPSSVPKPYFITPTTSSIPLPENAFTQPDPPVPSSYPLFAHLHSRGYYIMPGLRFGGDYNVYPGDPLRFHSHFIATGYEWDQEIPVLDFIGGGRLGTAVKKGFLIGGKQVDTDHGDDVRTFCIEWAGM